MLKPVQQKLFTTVNEVYNSKDYKIFVDDFVKIFLSDNENFKKAFRENRTMEMGLKPFGQQTIFLKYNLATVQTCKNFMNSFKLKGDGKGYLGLYLVKEIVTTVPQRMLIGPWNPYAEKFQEFIDVTFEAGLHKIWEELYYVEYNTLLKKNREIIKEKDFLEFVDILPFFVILAVGFLSALFALLCEIFYHDFVVNLSKEFLMEKFGKFYCFKRKKLRKV